MALSSQQVNSPDRWEAGPGGEKSSGCEPRLPRCVHIRACLAVSTAALPHEEASVPDSVLPACPSASTGGPQLYPPAPDTQLELTA